MADGILGGFGQLAQGAYDLTQDPKKLYGTKPIIPKYPTLTDAQAEAVQANIQTFPQATQLASDVNKFNQEQLAAMIDKMIPGASAKISKGINEMLSGEFDVSDILRSTAARALAGGFAGSGMKSALDVRDLGLNRINTFQAGLSSAESWLRQAGAPFDVTTMFITPKMKYQAKQDMFGHDLLEAKVAAAPDPEAIGDYELTSHAIGSLTSGAGNVLGGIGMMGVGGGMGGMAGAAGGGAGGGGTMSMLMNMFGGGQPSAAETNSRLAQKFPNDFNYGSGNWGGGFGGSTGFGYPGR